MAKRKKNRRIKKTKYLSLSLHFPCEKALINSSSIHHIPTHQHQHQHQQLHLLEKDGDGDGDGHHVEDNMEYLLSASDGGATCTLTELLNDSSPHVPVVSYSSPDAYGGADHELSPSASVSYVSEAMNLVRTALRSRERESSTTEERYVRYSQVVDDQRRRDHDEVSSRAGVGGDGNRNRNRRSKEINDYSLRRRLSLKLDYQHIINAWSDKPVHSDFPQTVPDIIDEFFLPPAITNGEGLWSVPEGNGGGETMSMLKMKEEEEVGVSVPQDEEHHRVGTEQEEEWKWKAVAGQIREASVLRYKEKRRNRLFSKTIRYQVRKENAQKRPRVKGRFVKRS